MNQFLETLTGHYKACPYGPAFTRTVEKAAEGLDADAQVDAAERLVRSRKAKGWPSLSDCEGALANARARIDAPVVASTYRSQESLRTEAIAEGQARVKAYALCRCDLGRRAARDGWLAALVQFATDNGRLPEDREIDRCVRLGERNADSLRALEPDPTRHWPMKGQADMYAAMCSLRRAMDERAYREVFSFVEAHEAAA